MPPHRPDARWSSPLHGTADPGSPAQPTRCDLAERVRRLERPAVAPLLAGLQHTVESFVEIGPGDLADLAWLLGLLDRLADAAGP